MIIKPPDHEPTTDDELFSDDDDVNKPVEKSASPGNQFPFDPNVRHTGPKGVRDDARLHDQIQFEIACQRSREQYEREYKRAAKTTTYQQDMEQQSLDDKRLKSRAKYGDLEKVDADGYLSATETVERLMVLVYDETQESLDISNALHDLARTEAEMDKVGIPAILGYRNGELKVNLVRVIDEIPIGQDVNAESLKQVLFRNGTLDELLGDECEDEDGD
ncbi:hypothetical protein NEOLI_004445 [Neolecta irregularis DAH-3]|uniref:Phosducin-like protein n=1 Tax=Neolecta irregularis (strain DAH-3) TaxID=1198029 RepID=A0A1U7LP98_NEOID|nr:hypothetical protein NEOLI_004445 [Neolecta irregularis DAH-3]|eukprot:OLL24474.1 hypothetical protein NEOLI_004445 [Neolecta irregularis DAH-3]